MDSVTIQLKGSIALPEVFRHSRIFFASADQLGSVNKTTEVGLHSSFMVNFSLTPTLFQDEFVASHVEIHGNQLYPVSECRLRLALQNLYVVGTMLSDEISSLRQLHFNTDDGFNSIVAGKDFILMTSESGKVISKFETENKREKLISASLFQVWYQGKASALGLKVNVSEVHHTVTNSSNRWSELPLPKCPKICQCATGHEGQHSLLLDESGAVYFVGLARRGEDGDLGESSYPK